MSSRTSTQPAPLYEGRRPYHTQHFYRFILHQEAMEKRTDDQVANCMVEQSQARCPSLRVVRFDTGFHSPSNRQALEERLELVALPKKGRHSMAYRERGIAPVFIRTRRSMDLSSRTKP